MSTASATYSRRLWLLSLAYTVALLMANWFAPRLVHLWGINTEAGVFVFPLTYLLADVITEVYGYKNARFAIWIALIANFIFILYGAIVTHLPSPAYHTNNALFDKAIDLNIRAIIASFCSYLAAEPLNAVILAKLKVYLKGRFMAGRFLVSTVIASGVDSAVFSAIAFGSLLTKNELCALTLTMWALKTVVEVLLLPFSIRMAKWIKRTEKIDIYDKGTAFTLLSLDTTYSEAQNESASKQSLA